jgi:5-methyltetrahydropteroyltriglutamate--homocysteine methyltransferase
MAQAFRADHLGSFLRPPELLKARAEGTGVDALRKLEDEHIVRLLKRQQDLGFHVFTDGELRRATFMSDFNESVDGVAVEKGVQRQWAGDAKGAPMDVHGVLTSKVRSRRRLTEHEVAFLKKHAPGPVKMTLPTPNQFPAIVYKKGVSDKIYPTYSDFLWDIVPIFKKEIRALVEEGVQYIQIDAPRYSYYIDPKWRAFVEREMGVDADKALDEAIKVDNATIEGAKQGANAAGVTLSMHLCRGNNRSQWYAQGGYDAIAEKLFGTLNVDKYQLEYDDQRSGNFEPLRFMPRGKKVVLGLVSSKLARLEDPKDLIRRIEEAAKFIPLEDLSISPQCGFASTLVGNELTEEEQWAKMKLVADVAKKVWGTTE